MFLTFSVNKLHETWPQILVSCRKVIPFLEAPGNNSKKSDGYMYKCMHYIKPPESIM